MAADRLNSVVLTTDSVGAVILDQSSARQSDTKVRLTGALLVAPTKAVSLGVVASTKAVHPVFFGTVQLNPGFPNQNQPLTDCVDY